jgi:asparagine synthetase B (glutamine-hydrolysing)
MCGIGAILRITPPGQRHEPIPESWLDALDEGIAWRGPDGAGRFRDQMTREDGSIVEVAMVHRRLAIIDIEGGAQPMVVELHDCPACAARLARRRRDSDESSDQANEPSIPRGKGGALSGRLAVVFNGCIYNHRELREELEAAGHVFRSDHSDTEVILHGLAEWNELLTGWHDEEGPIGTAGRLVGMYSLIIWDSSRGLLRSYQSPHGEKPLFGIRMDKVRSHVLASTASAAGCLARLVRGAAPPIRQVDISGLVDSVALGFSGRITPLREVTRLVGSEAVGHFDESVHLPPLARMGKRAFAIILSTVFVLMVLAICAGFMWGIYLLVIFAIGFLVSTGLIWVLLKLPIPWIVGRSIKSVRQRRQPKPSAEIEIEQLLELSVAQRLEADAPLGCFLSGGVDSSLIALMASRHTPDLVTLCVRMPDERYDESMNAQMVAHHLGTRHISLDCNGAAAADDLVRLIEVMGMPFGDSSILPTYWLCREARRHVKVALAGDGGDEMFYGYDRYKASRYLWWPKRTLIGLLPTGGLDRSDPKSIDERKARLITAARHGGYLDLLAIFPTSDRRALFGRAKGALAGRRYVNSSAAEMQSFDEVHYLPDDLLRKVDTASMLAGVEVRCPFLAPDLTEAADRIPARRHMAGGETKHILKQIARKYLPPQVIDRPKQGFAIPISDWWRTDFGGLGTLMMERLSKDRPFGVVHDALEIDVGFVRQMIDEHWAAGGLAPRFTTRMVRPRDHGQRLFALVALSIWAGSLE